MTARELVKTELDTLSDETVKNVLFENDSVYLSAISGMMDSIKKGIETPLSECKNLSEVWPDYEIMETTFDKFINNDPDEKKLSTDCATALRHRLTRIFA
jgi:hypothetical protein